MRTTATRTSHRVLLAGLQPFRRRAHRQRAMITFLRALSIALVAAALTLIVHWVLGLRLPMPGAPLVAGGVVLLAGLSLVPWQRPSAAQTAYTLDRALGLHEQLSTALEFDESSGPVAALLHRQARDTLHHAAPARAVPWPSIRRECASVIALSALLAASIFLVVQSTGPRPNARGPRTRSLSQALRIRPADRGTGARRVAARSQQTAPAHYRESIPGAQHGRGSPVQAVARFLNDPTARSAPASSSAHSGQGTTSQTQATDGQAQAGTDGTQTSQQASQGTMGKLTTGTAPRQGQQATQQAQSQGRSTHAQAGANTARTNGGSQGTRTRAPSSGTHGGQNQSGVVGGRPLGSPQASAQGAAGSANNGAGSSASQGNGSAGSGRGTGSGTHDSAGAPRATLSAGGGLTLTGSPDTGGQLTLSAGKSGRTIAGDTTAAGDSAGAGPNTPTYVAPDSNAVTPDDRTAIRGYFNPPPDSGR